MRLKFTKMQGAGNDFIVVDATREATNLDPQIIRKLANRHFGVGFDQLLVVEPPRSAGTDFYYRIFNADGGEVSQCGNGARCFVRYVHDRKLTDKTSIRVETRSGIIEPRLEKDGRVTVNLIAGSWNERQAPIQSLVDIHMVTLAFEPGGHVHIPVARDRNVFLYVVRGSVRISGIEAEPHHLIELENDADAVDIEAIGDAMLLFGHAQPLGEPVVSHGPFVMNTRDEIRQAMMDYQSGKFGGLPRV